MTYLLVGAGRKERNSFPTLLHTDFFLDLYWMIGIVKCLSVLTEKLIEHSVKIDSYLYLYRSISVSNTGESEREREKTSSLPSSFFFLRLLFCLSEQGRIKHIRFVYLCTKCVCRMVNQSDKKEKKLQF